VEAPSAEIGSLEAGQLSVTGSISAQQNLAANSMTIGPGGLVVQGDASAQSFIANGSFEVPRRFLVNATANRIEFGSRSLNTTLFVNGTINATGAITSNGGFDLAEAFSAEETLLPGELVIATGRHTVRKATADQASIVIGAVSTSPGFILDSAELPNRVFIGLAGRIPVLVEGTVNPGDFITVSDTPGRGKAATNAGFVIGRAISPVRSDGTVLMIIQAMYFSPQLAPDGKLQGSASNTKITAIARVGAEQGITRSNNNVVVLLGREDTVVTLG